MVRRPPWALCPHTDIERALEVTLSLDISFWPQLPKVSYLENMYVQALENFPEVRIDSVRQKVHFDLSRFDEELPSYFEKADTSAFRHVTRNTPAFSRQGDDVKE
jgi:hypothetical protein